MPQTFRTDGDSKGNEKMCRQAEMKNFPLSLRLNALPKFQKQQKNSYFLNKEQSTQSTL